MRPTGTPGIFVVVLVALVAVLSMPSCGQGSASQDGGEDARADAGGDGPATKLTAISVSDLHDALANKDFLLINVHIPRQGEIPGTDVHIPYNDINALTAYIGTDLDRQVVVYCMSNAMSTSAGNQLVALGYRAIRYLDGGMTAWQAAGYRLDP